MKGIYIWRDKINKKKGPRGKKKYEAVYYFRGDLAALGCGGIGAFSGNVLETWRLAVLCRGLEYKGDYPLTIKIF